MTQIDTVRAYTYTADKYIVEIDIVLARDMPLEVLLGHGLRGYTPRMEPRGQISGEVVQETPGLKMFPTATA